MKRKHLAHAAGLDPDTIAAIERGQTTPDAEILAAIARALDVAADLLRADDTVPR